jgi:hypothetical protein
VHARRFLLVLSALACGRVAGALEIERLDVSYADGHYRVDAVASVAVPRETVFAILTDYEHLDRLDAKVLASRLLERPEPDVAIVWMRVRGCVAFVCRELEQVERVEEHAPDEIRLSLIPERSDIAFETARWKLDAGDGVTTLHYELEMDPGSWVPFFGRGSVQRQLRSSFRSALAAVEEIGREAAPP